jgi:GLPGLI family protein
MTLIQCIKKAVLPVVAVLFTTASHAQITSGKIVFERRTNLKKTMGDNPRFKQFINDKNKIRKENFELSFNDSLSVFEYIEDENAEDVGMLKYFTQRNKVYQNIAQQEFFLIMGQFGDELYLKDSLTQRQWKVTDSKRKFAGFMCRKAFWEMNDSTRIYAWFSPDIVPSVGPEGFSGLPGAILGLATEDGSIVYFASSVEEAKLPDGKADYSQYKKDIFTKEELIAKLSKSMGAWVKPEYLRAMFAWY